MRFSIPITFRRGYHEFGVEFDHSLIPGDMSLVEEAAAPGIIADGFQMPESIRYPLYSCAILAERRCALRGKEQDYRVEER